MSHALNIRTYLSPNHEALYSYIAEQLSSQLNLPVTFEVGADFREFLDEPVDLAFACGFWYVQNALEYEPLVAPVMSSPRYGQQPVYFVDLVVRVQPSQPYFDLTELDRKIFGFNEIQSFSGYHALVAELARQNLPDLDAERLVETGSHLNSLNLLLQGKLDYASLDSTVLDFELERRPALVEQIHLALSLGPYPVPPLLINKRVEPSLRAKILEVISSLPALRLAQFGISSYRLVERDFYSPLAAINQSRLLPANPR